MASPTLEVLRASGRQYIRQPMNLVLLAILPPLFVVALGEAFSTFSDVLGGNIIESQGSAMAAVWAAALLGASGTFFVLSASRRADERLVIAGLNPLALLAAQGSAALMVAAATGTAGFVVVLLTRNVADPASLWLAVVVGSAAYAALGALLASTVEGDLEGSFIVILVFMLDAFVAGPLGGAGGAWPNLFPLHLPSEIAMKAMAEPAAEASRLSWAVGYAVLLGAVAAAAHRRRFP